MRFYIGTYTKLVGNVSKGIYMADLCPESGEISSLRLVAEIENPSFLALHPHRPLLYSVSELGQGDDGPLGSVSAFDIDLKSGSLALINTQRVNGTAPCHLVVDATGRHLLSASYGSGTVCTMPITESGGLAAMTTHVQHEGSSVNPSRQEAAHAHSINLDAANRFALVCDLGADKTYVYRFDSDSGTLTANSPDGISSAPGAGPRHLAYHPGGRFAYVINELDGTMNAYGYAPEAGRLTEIQTLSTLPEGWEGETSCADVHVDAAGRFLYGSNRGHDSVVIYEIDASTGRLTLVGHESTGGKTPRNFAIDPTGEFLLAANQDSDSLVVFKRDPAAGTLVATGSVCDVPAPICIQFTGR